MSSAYPLVSDVLNAVANAVRVSRYRPARLVVAIIVISFVLRCVLSAALGLGIDESYMVAAGRQPQLSYFDHPPVSWWLAWGAAQLFRSEAPIVVRLPFIVLFAASTWILFALTARLFSRRAGLWAVVAFNLAPVFGVTSASWVLPDGPLIASLLGFLFCLAEATRPGQRATWAFWLGVGACGGLAMLSKYNASLVLAGAAVAVLSHPEQRRWLWRKEPWCALLLAVTLFLPVIVWNAEHHWASIAFVGGRTSGQKWHLFAPLVVLGGEALYVLPWLWLPLVAALVRGLRNGPQLWPSWLLAWCATPAILLFPIVGLWSNKPVLFHWAVPGYLVLFPLLGDLLARLALVHGRTLRLVGAASAGLIVLSLTVIGSEVRWNCLAWVGEDYALGADPDLAAVDWTSLVPQMRSRGWIGDGEPVLAALHWHDAGKLSYAVGGLAVVLCLGDDPREFGLIEPGSRHLGEDMLVLVPGGPNVRTGTRLAAMFQAVEPQAGLTLMHEGRPAMTIAVYLGLYFAPRTDALGASQSAEE